MKIKLSNLLCIFAILSLDCVSAAGDWAQQLREELPLLGHRNWIVVVDSAYPLQTSPGVETIYANRAQLDVVREVLAELTNTKHVKPVIFTDAEMKFVPEAAAPGIGAYREELGKLMAGAPLKVMPHEEIIAKLDEAGKAFKVLVIKTPLTLPYTSVFFQLECGYWDATLETQLREAIREGH